MLTAYSCFCLKTREDSKIRRKFQIFLLYLKQADKIAHNIFLLFMKHR